MAHQAGPGLIQVSNENNNMTERITKGGKRLRYELRIIQQPERARACGAGAKASADRRPVDPPPILQLQVFEVLPNGDLHDVTFTMHANYFLYATLERGRNMAAARNVQDPKAVDVLTGTNVAGMQPFDRPTPAIYFILPDLSVRHEGKYRLNFSLFEDTRRTEDEDRNEPSTLPSQPAVSCRLDVRSSVFDVFSAKRFPGLSESTSLSRTFAEQGSRIRIRRDIRMRRGNNKPSSGKDWDEYDDDHAQTRLSQTPDPYGHAQMQRQTLEPGQRPRSSNGQGHHLQQPTRRTSLNEMGQQYQVSQSNDFAFPHAYGSAPSQAYAPASSLHPPQMNDSGFQTSSMMPTPQQQQQTYFGYGTPQSMSQLQYPSITTNFDNSYQQRNSGDYSADSRRGSVQSLAPQSQQMYTPQSAHSQTSLPAFPRQPQLVQSQAGTHHSSLVRTHAPPEPIQPPTRVTTPAPPTLTAKSSFGTTLPPLSTSFPHKLEAASPVSATTSNTYNGSFPTPVDSHKRSFGNSFQPAWQDGANKQGARPEVPASSMFLAPDADGDDTVDLAGPSYLRVYRRAGGSTVSRQMP
ncbi:hypothetical protein AMS68_007308 [Peltaster fructicola]|uniref:Velvet domain-containing protein n=1 Tax=Peltaster fructicola TaxID=286661 RepID=A0A6H0Y4E6_9PEZI|nr:hypothetical protein AMS68_007308 [Peltaster fructicola]